jgi:hypothetical protein
MSLTLTWQDFMKRPENKKLLETKGMSACKSKFLQEQNKLQWDVPNITPR